MTARIMIVDDHPSVTQLVSITLKHSGFISTLKAHDADTALRLLEEGAQPDLFILDIMMPGMNGIELTQHLRSQSQTAQTPILILSAKSDSATIEQAFEAGATDYLTKPAQPGDLIEKVRSLLPVRVGE
jgi:CheY-like chemotaxis protein